VGPGERGRRHDNVAPGQRAEALVHRPQARHRAWYPTGAGTQDRSVTDLAGGVHVHVARGGERSGLPEVEGEHLAVVLAVHEEPAAAEVSSGRIHDGLRKGDGHDGVDRMPPRRMISAPTALDSGLSDTAITCGCTRGGATSAKRQRSGLPSRRSRRPQGSGGQLPHDVVVKNATHSSCHPVEGRSVRGATQSVVYGMPFWFVGWQF
jgi:hypothetical protein